MATIEMTLPEREVAQLVLKELDNLGWTNHDAPEDQSEAVIAVAIRAALFKRETVLSSLAKARREAYPHPDPAKGEVISATQEYHRGFTEGLEFAIKEMQK
jgi:hypothetical protein